MAGRVRASDIEELKARVNIADIIGEYVSLRPASAGSLKGLCPFHSEKSPSFNVRASPGFYHCFGCGEGGDVFKFLQQIESMSFADAVERLASRVGFELQYEDGNDDRSSRTRLLAANAAAAEYFRRQLLSDEALTAREFILSRGFSAEDATRFGVGYAPRGWHNLSSALKAQGFSDDEVLAAGLCAKSERGLYDKFRGRVLWPIKDANGQVLGFGARKLFDDDEGPKYLNTSDTAVYHKSTVLYGLDLARKEIVKTRQIVVVEGYTDVMACHLAGFPNAVATCGTAFGEEHIRIINRLFGSTAIDPAEVIFTFDPDVAGQKAALRVYSDSHKFNALTFVAIGPDGLDPADLRLQRGDAAVKSMLGAKRPLFEFVIRHRIAKFDLSDVGARVAAARAAAEVVANLVDPSLRSAYTRMLADLVSLEIGEVAQIVTQVAQLSRKQAVTQTSSGVGEDKTLSSSGAGWAATDGPDRSRVPVAAEEVLDRKELHLLEVVVQRPELLDLAKLRRISGAGLLSRQLQQVLDVAISIDIQTAIENHFDALLQLLPDALRSLAIRLLAADLPVLVNQDNTKYCQAVVDAALATAMQRERSDLLLLLRRLDANAQPEETQQVQQQLVELEAERRQLLG